MLSSADTIKSQGVFHLPLKNAAQSTVDIRDICAIAAKALVEDGHERKTYVITGPEALTFQQVAETLSNVLGREIRYIDVPLSVAADGMRKAGMPDWNVRIVSELLDYFASGAAATVSDAVPRLLGRPAISFEQFAKDHRGVFQPRCSRHAVFRSEIYPPRGGLKILAQGGAPAGPGFIIDDCPLVPRAHKAKWI